MKTKLATMAVAMLAATGASAADLGRPAPAAVDYVKVCDAYGKGFFYIPGTQTCLKIDGYVRADFRTGESDWYYRTWSNAGAVTGTSYAGSLGGSERTRNDIYTRARALLHFDARTNTEFGLLRSYIEAYWTVDSGTNGAVATALDQAYVQWGGLTAGRAQSFFDFFTGYGYGMLSHEIWGDAKTNLLAYTFAFGNGVSASLSIEDPSTNGRRRGATADFAYGTFSAAGTGTGTVSVPAYYALAGGPSLGFTYQGVKLPDVVANLRIDQAWGSAQLAVAAHHLYGAAALTTGHASIPVPVYGKDDWGWAVQGGVKVNLPMLGAGDSAFLQGGYADGAMAYICLDCINFRSIGADAVITAGGALKTTTAWAVSGGLNHVFTPTISASIEGGYASVDGFGARDYNQLGAGGTVIWTPAAGLSIGSSLEYRNIDFSNATSSSFTGLDAKGAGYRVKDADAWLLGLRVQRSF